MTDTNEHPPLHINRAVKVFGKETALKDATLTLNQGEIFGLIGLNGAGKTTMIKVVLDLIRATSGSAECFGVDSSKPEARKNLSYLPEKFQPPRHLTGKEYLSLVLSYYGKTLDIPRAEAMAEKLHLKKGALFSRIGSYSKGMGQKIGLIGALMVDTPLFILDEPMSGLDPKARIALKNLLEEQRAAGRTVFFSSHILSDIDEICNRIGVIHYGKLLYVGTPSEFKKIYRDEVLEKAFLDAINKEDIAAAAALDTASESLAA